MQKGRNNTYQHFLEDEDLYCSYCGFPLDPSNKDLIFQHFKCRNCGHSFRIPNDDDKFKEYRQTLYEAIDDLPNKNDIEIAYKKEFRDVDLQYSLYEAALYTKNFKKTSAKFKIKAKAIDEDIKNPHYPLSNKGKELLQNYKSFVQKIKVRSKALFISLIVFICLLACAVGIGFFPKTSNSVWKNEIATVSTKSSFWNKVAALGIEFTVENIESGSSAHSVATRALDGELSEFFLLDLKLTKDGIKHENKNSLNVVVDIPSHYEKHNVAVYHILDDGNREEVACTVSPTSDTVSFVTEHFSMFAIGVKPYNVVMETGTSFVVENQKTVWGELVSEPRLPDRTGYVFNGWFLNDTPWDFSKDFVTHDITLTAKWTPKNYTITLDSNNGSNNSTSTITAIYDQIISISDPYYHGYRFMGWFDENGNQYKTGAWKTDNDVSLKAKWELIVFNIVYDGNGANSGSTADPAEIYHNVNFTTALVKNEFYRTGYSFIGWNTKADGSGLSFEDQNQISFIDAVDSNNTVKLYAQWSNHKYNILFNINTPDYAMLNEYTGDISGKMQIKEIEYDTRSTLPKNSFAISGWKFMGWSEDKHGEAVYSDNYTVLNLSADDGALIVLYAVWEVDPYSIGKYVKNGSTVYGTNEKNSYIVYNLINETPKLKNLKNAIIDWSRCEEGEHDYISAVNSSGTRYGGGDNDLDITNLNNVYFIGNPNSTYTNLFIYLTDYTNGTKVNIYFDSFKFNGLIKSKNHPTNLELSIYAQNDNYITACKEKYAISTFNDIRFLGEGNITVTGRNGANATVKGGNGADGEPAINVKAIYVSMTGRCTIIGGNGGNGMVGEKGQNGNTNNNYDKIYDNYNGIFGAHIQTIYRYHQATAGLSGQNGGNGGNGALPVECDIFVANIGSVKLVYGNGGNGGDGGKGGDGGVGRDAHGSVSGIAFITFYEPGKGGNGGVGGKGGDAGHTASEEYSFDLTNIQVIKGKSGKAGSGGLGGNAGRGGYGDSVSATANNYSAGNAKSGDPGKKGNDGNP